MVKRKTNLVENGLMWFGAAVSLAEVLTGASVAPLGIKNYYYNFDLYNICK